MALLSVRLGSNDVERSAKFYDATFQAVGWGDARSATSAPIAHYRLPGNLSFIVAKPRDGEQASAGNGDTLVWSVADSAMVDQWYAAGLDAGGTCEGAPGAREPAGGRYGAYLRDPDGHKLGVYALAK